MTTKTKAIMGLGLVAGVGAVMVPLASYAVDADTATTTIDVAIAETISVESCAKIDISLTTSDVENNTLVSRPCAVTANTNNAAGATLTFSMIDGDPHTGQLWNSIASMGIPGNDVVSGTKGWGYNTNGGATYSAVPASNAPVTVSSTSAAGPLAATVTLGVKGDSTLNTGHYENTVQFVATTK